MKFELCTDSAEGAALAGNFGFTSVELCSALSIGGLTPNFGLIKQSVRRSKAAIHVMIRHREGGFQATSDDLLLMRLDIEAAKKAGAYGVVFGILDKHNGVDKANKGLVELAEELGLKTTFHRAFDFVPDYNLAMKKILSYGFDRLLTSGLKAKALDGLHLIAELQQDYGDRIQIIAGSGVNEHNAMSFSSAGIDYIHFTARKTKGLTLPMEMGQEMITDTNKIKEIISLPFE